MHNYKIKSMFDGEYIRITMIQSLKARVGSFCKTTVSRDSHTNVDIKHTQKLIKINNEMMKKDIIVLTGLNL
jgi:hypothetical protein